MSKDKKKEQLGVAYGTAANRLRKSLLWDYVCKAGDNVCFQCGELIESIDDLSIEHKEPWLDSGDPKGLFFSLDNIAYSHLSCNCAAGKRVKHDCGSYASYKRGCRCQPCVEAQRAYHVLWKKENYCPERRKKQYLRTGK